MLASSNRWAASYRFTLEIRRWQMTDAPAPPGINFQRCVRSDDAECPGINFHVGINSDTLAQTSRLPFTLDPSRPFASSCVTFSTIPRLSAPLSLRDPGKAMDQSISFRFREINSSVRVTNPSRSYASITSRRLSANLDFNDINLM